MSLKGNFTNYNIFRNEWVNEQWKKHGHVQWLIGMSQKLTKDTLDFLKAQFNIRTRSSINDANTSQDRHRKIVEQFGEIEKRNVEKLLEDLKKWIKSRFDENNWFGYKLKGEKDKTTTALGQYIAYREQVKAIKKDLEKDMEKVEEELAILLDSDVTPVCPVTGSKIADITSELASVSFAGVQNIETITQQCQAKMTEYFKQVNQKYEEIQWRIKYKKPFDDLKTLINALFTTDTPALYEIKYTSTRFKSNLKPQQPTLQNPNLRQASTTEDEWSYDDNIFDILIRNNENLITALVGKFPADENKNLLTGMEVKICLN